MSRTAMRMVFGILLLAPLGSVEANSYIEQVASDMEKEWPSNKTINIVVFGHSVPAGYFKTPIVNTRQAYPRLVADGLAERYPNAVINVITSAVGGENSSQGNERFIPQALAYRPRVLILDYALNDRGLSIGQSRSNLIGMIERAKESGACVVLVTPTPDLSGDSQNAQSSLDQQRAMIVTLATLTGTNLAGASKAFSEYSGSQESLMSQSNHPNARGHELIAKAVLALFPQ